MIKKTVLTIILAGLIFSCVGRKEQDRDGQLDAIPEQSSEVLPDSFDDEHNARNSLDYMGIYEGTLPTASGLGMKVTIELKDSTYARTVIYLKGNDKFVDEGSYIWDSTGSIITLEGVEPANMYFAGENTLIALDIDGKRIEGELAAHYRLAKQ